jgi:hypothetical protein
MAAYVFANQVLTIILNGKAHTVSTAHPNYQAIKESLNNDVALTNLLDVSATINKYTGKKVEVIDGEVFYQGEALHNVLTDRILGLMREQMPFEGFVKFLENIMENPSSRAVNELYKFLENRALPIDQETGYFIAYKAVQADYYSKTAGDTKLIKGTVTERRIYNGIGEEIECARNAVNDNCNETCSHGLHVGAIPYVQGFAGTGDKIVMVLVNPKDVVSVPIDENAMKVRVCKYKVLCDYTGPLEKPMYTVTDKEIAETPRMSWQESYPYDDSYDDEDDSYGDSYDDDSYEGNELECDIDFKPVVEPAHCNTDCHNLDCVCEPETYGIRPDGTRFFNVRGKGGQFTKKE